MPQPYKDAVSICKTLMRNGYDAYVINARLQNQGIDDKGDETAIDICSELPLEGLGKYFPGIKPSPDESCAGVLKEGGVAFHFYQADMDSAAHPEESVVRMTPRLLKALEKKGELPFSTACPFIPKAEDKYDGFADLSEQQIRLKGSPDLVLKKDYMLALRALRFAANYHLPIEPNTWMAIVRAAKRVVSYAPGADIMDEWRKVEAENMWQFVQHLYETQLLHGLMPDIASLSKVRQIRNTETGEEESVLAHTIEVMRRYPEELPYDWYGTMACLFHDVGKLYAAEYIDETWTFYQHHRIGAKITHKILSKLGFQPEDVNLLTHLVRHHMHFHFMLTDKGVRRFRALDEYPRLIEMVRADVKARGSSYREFNHNMKLLERADIPEEILEPFMNGNQIMQATDLKAGPAVGLIREALLKAQIHGDVANFDEAVEFVKAFKKREKL
ncbi:MAG: poly(A) polymerase [Desulfovibrionales bacterium]|jgi:poly(A) polymerase|nr:poly(A) polymerase [Desulfovibrionales bacterium]